ncbi:MAG: hypothetical protein CK424_06505 [Legionella sp.]|nr:MAG: hypothetical protein CK424_06505 [Legionella sp.]
MKTHLQKSLHTYLPFCLAVLMFCIPLGPTFKSIGIILAVGVIVISPLYRQNLAFMFSQPISFAAIGLCGVTLLACIWSSASPAQEFSMVEKYAKLLYLPILAAGFCHKRTRQYGIQAFILGMMITCFISFYKYFYAIPQLHELIDPGKVFYNHIITGYMMALAAYLAAWTSIHTCKTTPFKILYGVIAILFSIQVLFVNIGRTGYVIYALLFGLLFLQHMSLKSIRYILLFFVCSLGLLIQQTKSDTLQTRLHMILSDVHQYQGGHENSSLGFRLQFHKYAKTLFLAKPLLGQGTGSFTSNFFVDNPIPEWDQPLPDAHSQYWLIASEFGILGLIALGCFFALLIQLSYRLQEMKSIFQAILLPFLVANVSDALLVNSGIGYLFIAFTGLCLGEWVETKYHAKFPFQTSSSNDAIYSIG